MKTHHIPFYLLTLFFSANLHAQSMDVVDHSIQKEKQRKPLIIVNGYELIYSEYLKIKPNQIESMITLDEADAKNVFGEKGSGGAIVIRLIPLYSKYYAVEAKRIDDLIIEKVKHIAKQRAEEKKREEEARVRKEAEEKARLERAAAEKAEKERAAK